MAEQKAEACRKEEAVPAEETVQETPVAETETCTEQNPLQAQVEKLEEELKTLREQHLRTLAEYDNFRKRTEREKANIYTDATVTAVSALLPVADNMDRALEQKDCSAEDLRRGVEMIGKQMVESLKKLGVEEMAGVGEEFNPDLHNAVSHIDDENLEENVISAVFQKGYLLGEKVVRHAMVQVAN